MGFDEVGLEADCVVKAVEGFAILLKSGERVAADGVELGDVGIGEDSLAGEFDRGGILSELVSDDAEEIQRVDVVGVELEDLTIDGLRLGELPGLVIATGLLELEIEELAIDGCRCRSW